MIKKFLGFVLTFSMLFSVNAYVGVSAVTGEARQMEYLTRGAVGAAIDGNIYLSWRLLGTEPMDATFNIYCNNQKIVSELANTNYTHEGGSVYNSYQIAAVINGVEQARSANVEILQGYRDSSWKNSPYAYFDIPLSVPAAKYCGSYSANDSSAGDVDGDGEYEVIVKWDPDNSKDSSNSGVTGNVYIDAYKMNGTLLWRIDLGRNMRAGAHYNPYIVYDLDGDGKAEIAMKTAPGTKDGTGGFVTAAGNTAEIRSADNSKEYIASNGHITSGPEYVTVFDGLTGAALSTVDYFAPTGTLSSWGDSSANRSDRYLAGVGYFDGVHPSFVMCRGYYDRSAAAAYNWDGENLTVLWSKDTGTNSNDAFFGQGNHQVSIADLDNDGYDELIYGSAALDHDGTLLHSTGWGHGDALHVSDFNNDGEQEIFSVLEDSPTWGTGYRKGDGTVLWKKTASFDVGRGIMAVISEKYGALGWSSQGMYDQDGNEVDYNFVNPDNPETPNFAIYWDGDLLRELIDGNRMTKWNDKTNNFDRLWTISGVSVNNSSKKNPCLQADLFGDWREEMIFRLSDDSALRVFTSITPTDYMIPTLMHDSQYRCAVAWQNSGYNQPPHQSFYIGSDKTEYTQPNITGVTLPNSVSFKISAPDGSAVEAAQVFLDDRTAVTDSSGRVLVPVLPGSHTYYVKAVGYDKTEKEEFTIDENTTVTEISKTLAVKENCDISVSFLTSDGKTLKPAQSLGSVPIMSGYALSDEYKEDITDGDGIVYEYSPDLSSDTTFDSLVDDAEITLVFEKSVLPGQSGTLYYRTNFSKDGFSADSEKHGYAVSSVQPSYKNLNEVKAADYSLGNGSITINTDGYSEFTVEFDMAFTPTENTAGGDFIGLNLNSGNTVGPTIGMRYNSSYTCPQIGIYRGSGSGQTDSLTNLTSGKMYRYVIECDGENVYLTVGDSDTGGVILNKTQLTSLRNLKLSTQKVNKFVFNRIYGSGTSDITLSDFRVYKVGGPNSFEWANDEKITVNIPSETDISCKGADFTTGISDYKIEASIDFDNFSYTLKNYDDTLVTTQAAISIDEGVLKVGETAHNGGRYKVIAKYGSDTVRIYNITLVKSSKIDVYNASKDSSGTGFVYSGDSSASLSFLSGSYTFNQDSVGGREFIGDFYPTENEEAEVSFTFSTGGLKDSDSNWNWDGREYNYKIQFLDADYDGENPDEHEVFSLSQSYAEKVSELLYSVNMGDYANVKSDAAATGTIESAGITARSSITLNVDVKFNFSENLMSFSVLCVNSNNDGGYVYENIPITGGFKAIRFVSSGESTVQWKPTVANFVYSKVAYEPSPADGGTIDLSGEEDLIVDFAKPYDGGMPVTYTVTLADSEGNEISKKETDTIPVSFESIDYGYYIIKIKSSNVVGESEEITAGPLLFYNKEYPFKIIPDDGTSLGEALSFTANIKNNTGEVRNALVIASAYDENGVLLDSVYLEKDWETGDNSEEFSLDTKNKDSVTIKFFVWDSKENMQPFYNTPAIVKTYNK